MFEFHLTYFICPLKYSSLSLSCVGVKHFLNCVKMLSFMDLSPTLPRTLSLEGCQLAFWWHDTFSKNTMLKSFFVRFSINFTKCDSWITCMIEMWKGLVPFFVIYVVMWWYTPLCRTRRSPLCPVWVICPSVNLQKPLLWTVICPTVFYLLMNDSNIENIYNITVNRVWLYIVPANAQHILVWFGINLQGSFDPFRWSSLITFAGDTVKLRRPLSKVA